MNTVISTDPIELDVVSFEEVVIPHGLGRQVAGWLVIWSDNHIDFQIVDSSDDTSKEIRLLPDADAKVRIVLL